MAKKYLPQQSILAHPKVILYFGHGGVNGLHEAIHFRKPIVAMAIWSDGKDNLQRLREKGVAEEVLKGDDADTIYNTIIKVRDNARLV